MSFWQGFEKSALPHKTLAKALEHNKANPGERKSFHITYRKANGRTVKRKIDPLQLKGELLVAHDHKRKALRSFRMDRMSSMKTAAFLDGFLKVAEERKTLSRTQKVLLGAATVGAGVAAYKNKAIRGAILGHDDAKIRSSRMFYQTGHAAHEKSLSKLNTITKKDSFTTLHPVTRKAFRKHFGGVYDSSKPKTVGGRHGHTTVFPGAVPNSGNERDRRDRAYRAWVRWDKKPSKKSIEEHDKHLKAQAPNLKNS